jgi:hypothetical protein
MLGILPESINRRSTAPLLKMCSCPNTSSNVCGRKRSASGWYIASTSPFLTSIAQPKKKSDSYFHSFRIFVRNYFPFLRIAVDQKM